MGSIRRRSSLLVPRLMLLMPRMLSYPGTNDISRTQNNMLRGWRGAARYAISAETILLSLFSRHADAAVQVIQRPPLSLMFSP